MHMGVWRRLAVASIVVATGVVVLPHGVATTTQGNGEGFDTCDALPTSAMRTVTGYAVANLYIGDAANLACAQKQLTADWVSTVAGAGWRLIPTFIGKQAPCTTSGVAVMSSDPSTAGTQGSADADTAASRMTALRLPPPNVVYDDMEAYNAADATCSAAVAAYLDAFIARLHSHGFRAGVYGSTASTVAQLVAAYNNPARQRPDDIWIADPDGVDTTADASVPSSYWVHRRVRQYTLNSTLTVPTNDPSNPKIDNDAVDGDTAAPNADQLSPYVVIGTASVGHVNERNSPSSGSIVTTDNEGTTLDIVCQTTGDAVAKDTSHPGDSVWDKLADGNYVSDLYTSTPGGFGFAGTLPRCDDTPTARLITPLDGSEVNEGATVTAQVDVPVAATSVQFETSPDGATWTPVASTGTAGNGVATASFAPAGGDGTTLHLRATITDGVSTWHAVNTSMLHIVAPRVTIAAVPAGTKASVYTFSWTGVDGAARATAYDVTYHRAPWNGGFGAPIAPSGWTGTTSTSKALSLAEGYEYCVQVRAYGVFGNVGDWTPANTSCIARPLDDRAMTAGTGWVRGKASGYYDGTYSSSKTYGAALTRTGATVDKVGILATTCATCGSVAVYVGNTHVGTISLSAPHTRLQQLLTVKQFGLRAGATITLRVATSGKLVQIDGLLVCHTSTGLPHAG